MELSCIISIILCALPLLVMYVLVIGPLISQRNLDPATKGHYRTQRLWFSLAILLCLIGGLFLVSMVQAVGMTIRSINWQQAEGVVISSHYEDFSHTVDTSTIYSYKGTLSYQFSVDGKTYISNRPGLIHDFVMFDNENNAIQFVHQYAPEKRVVVFYNPEKPEEAVLDRGIDIQSGIVLICFTCLAGGTFSLRQGIKMRKFESKPA
jgi:hypothetical protein